MDDLQKIYIETLKEKNSLEEGYLVSYRPLNANRSYLSIVTEWVGQQGKKEVRRAAIIDTVTTKAHFRLLNYPLSIVGDIRELTSFLKIGGHAIICEKVIEENWSEILCPKIVVDVFDSLNHGYIDYASLENKYKERFARGRYRMEIFHRDGYQCKICGSSPDDGVHIRLEVHHIKPWEEGGITTPGNLITLCASCHEGAKIIDRELLYNKIGLKFPLVENELFIKDISWSRDQWRSYNYFLSNAVLVKINNSQ